MVDDGVRIGYVHAVYEQLLKEKREIPSFFLCGWKDMINDARQRLQGIGIDRKSIHFELYG
jgi:CDP-4-dehydro-6-deoxyglucose reductase